MSLISKYLEGKEVRGVYFTFRVIPDSTGGRVDGVGVISDILEAHRRKKLLCRLLRAFLMQSRLYSRV